MMMMLAIDKLNSTRFELVSRGLLAQVNNHNTLFEYKLAA
jgi:hypothetical protein